MRLKCISFCIIVYVLYMYCIICIIVYNVSLYFGKKLPKYNEIKMSVNLNKAPGYDLINSAALKYLSTKGIVLTNLINTAF